MYIYQTCVVYERAQIIVVQVQKHSFDFIKLKVDELQNLKVLVVGATIIDQYVFCEALGKSGKEPVLVLRDLETQQYLGGVLAIARHLIAFCNTVSVLSFLGNKKEQKTKEKLRKPKKNTEKLGKTIKNNFFQKNTDLGRT